MSSPIFKNPPKILSYPEMPDFLVTVKDLRPKDTLAIENSSCLATSRLKTPDVEASRGKWDVRNFLVESIDLNTSLHLAAIRGETENIKFLIKKGADVNSTIFSNFTPLHFAAMRCHLHAFITLVESGANLYAKSTESKIPFTLFASKCRDHEKVKYLRKKLEEISRNKLINE
ncbi:MAG: hypothetical protein ChlgKO_04500 [Chlamydiales bacterium]